MQDLTLEALTLFLKFMNSLPIGWLSKTSGDIGLLNDAYITARHAFEQRGLKMPERKGNK